MPNLRVCIIFPYLPSRLPDGGSISTVELSEALVELGCTVHLLTSTESREREHSLSEILHLHYARGLPSLRLRSFFINCFSIFVHKHLKRMIEKNQIDVIHAQYCTVNFSGLLTCLGVDKMPVPLIYTVHGPVQLVVHAQKVEMRLLERIAHSLFISPLVGLERYSIRTADKVLAVSDYVAKDVINRFGVKPWSISVIPNLVDSDKFYPDACVLKPLDSLVDCPTILHVGGASPVKGASFLLHAMRYLVSEKPNLKLLFICSSNDKLKLMRLAERLGVRNYCVFLGEVPHDDMPKVYAASTVLALPSLYESFSLTILEAMACGKPVVATNVGGIPEIVVNNETGFLVEPRNALALATAILRIIENDQMARKMGSSGRERVKQHYAKNLIARKVLNVYERCLTKS